MRTNQKGNISKDLARAMCCGCGVCAAICPVDAISINVTVDGINFPSLDEKQCIDCKKCRQVCPGINTDHDDLNIKVFGKLPENTLIGNYLSIYKGYSLNKKLRFQCSSGGLVTQTLLYLLERKIISSALVTKLVYGEKIRAVSFLASTEAEIIESRGSKYCPVSLDNPLREVRKKQQKIAVVCLPCQAIAIRKAMMIDENLRNSVQYIFSLFCNQSPSYRALKQFLRKIKINDENVRNFQWRGGGWPGSTKIITKNGKEFSLSFPLAWSEFFGNDFFTPYACFLCNDFFGEFSNLSFGDAWLPEQSTDTMGANVIISRSLEAEEMLLEMQQKGVIYLEKLEKNRLLKAFFSNLKFKKTYYPLRKILCCSKKAEFNRDGNSAGSIVDAVGAVKRFVKIKLGELLLAGK